MRNCVADAPGTARWAADPPILEVAEASAGGPHAGGQPKPAPTCSPNRRPSLKITLRQLTIGRDYDLDAALVLEYRLTQHVMAGHDFYEGIRAILIDRDRKQQWRPASLAEVSESMSDGYFAPIGDREL